jgi:hypothetical protein
MNLKIKFYDSFLLGIFYTNLFPFFSMPNTYLFFD